MRQIHKLSITDTLTNTANRCQFNNLLNQEWRRCMRFRSPLSLLLLDVDHFKGLNDRYGHMQGDVVLQTIDDLVKGELKRSMDMLARWGGEEFAIVLPDTDIHGAYKVAEGIRIVIENHPFLSGQPNPAKVTVSIGVNSIVPEKDITLDRFVSDTDRALYRAKETGRNKVSTAAPAKPASTTDQRSDAQWVDGIFRPKNK